jgi:hypothetical protein
MTVNRDLGKLTPIPSVAGQFVWNQATTSWQQVTKAMVGLGNATNTADADKPVSTAQQAALDLKLNAANPIASGIAIFGGSTQVLAGVITNYGDFTATRTSGNTAFNLNGPAGNQCRVAFYTNLSARWTFGKSNGAESGSNAGSDFWVSRFADDGSGIDVALRIIRATGETQTMSVSASGPVKPGQYTLTTLPSASLYSGYEIDVTNATGGSKRCRSNGTVWQILNTTTTVS